MGCYKRYENNYKVLNLITTALGRNMYHRVSHLETVHDVCFKLFNTYEDSSELSLHVEILITSSTRLFSKT
jgi:hypothetical protein